MRAACDRTSIVSKRSSTRTHHKVARKKSRTGGGRRLTDRRAEMRHPGQSTQRLPVHVAATASEAQEAAVPLPTRETRYTG